MPVSPTYPGVYVEEIPSGVRTITGVATSITAFIGRAARGPVNEPVMLNSYGDYERVFGGLGVDYPASYAIRDFYLNGGSQALMVRLYRPDGVKKTKAELAVNGLNLVAASEGSWGNKLRVRADLNVSADVAARFGLATTDLFNLTVRDMATGQQETFLNLTGKDSPRRVDRVLKSDSALVRVPDAAVAPFTVPTAHGAPAAGKTVWEDDNASSKVVVAGEAVDGLALDQTAYEGKQDDKTGLFALEKADLFNLMCIMPDARDGEVPAAVLKTALKYCVDRRAFLIVDAPKDWNSVGTITANNNKALTDLGLTGDMARNAALYFPRIVEPDPKRDGQLDTFVASGMAAGVMARTDAQRGVWKAPAGVDAALNGAQALKVVMTDNENGQLNPLGVNCLRNFPIFGNVVWGARTLRGADLAADEYKYVPVRRLALFLEESLYRGMKWVVFEPNDEPLWAQIRLNVGAFMQNLFRQGAFQGKSPREAYFVKCDRETTTQNDINLGIVNILVGFAPLKPAEFVILKIQQMAGQIQS